MLSRGRASLYSLLLLSALAVMGRVTASAQELAVADRGPRFLRQVSATEPPVEIDMNATPVLRHRISLTRDAATLGQILGAIRRQAGLKFIYSADVVPANREVGLRADSITVAAALTEILLDAGVDVIFYSAREAGLVQREPAQTGTIAGNVADGKTGAALAGATVTVGGTSLGTTAGNDGHYRITGVPAGTYFVRARYIGYAPGMVSVTVSADQEATADFTLEKSAQQLDEVISTGTVVPTEVRALPTPVSVINESDIALQRPHTVQELFRQAVPSAVSWDAPSIPHITLFSTRGASSLGAAGGQMKVFVDGIEAANPTFAAVDLSSVERIEVIRGPQAAAIYGSDAIGGVIQIFTKRGDPNLAHPQVDAESRLGLMQTPYAGRGGVFRQEYKAAVRGGGSDVSYNVGGGYSHTGDYVPNGDISRQSSPSVYGGMHFTRGIISVDASGRYYAENTANIFNPDLSQTGFIGFSKPNYQPLQTRNQTMGARIGVSPTRWWQHTLTVGLDRYNQNQVQTQARLTTPADTLLFVSDYTYTKTSIGYNTSVQGSLRPGVSGSLTAGFDHYSNPITQWYTFGARTTTGTIENAPGYSFTTSRTITNNTGYFAQAQLGFRDVLFLTGGLRAEQNSAFGDSLGTPVSPRVGLSYVQPLGQATLKLRGSWGRAIRAPDPVFKATVVTASSVTLANPQLGPERQHGWDVGLDAVFGSRGSLGVTYYDQTADRLIDRVPVDATASPPTFQFQNIGRVKNTGVEVEGTLFAGPVQLKAQYAYTRARVEQLAPNYTGDLRVGDQTLLTPKHTAGALLTVAPYRGTTVAAGLTYVGTWNLYDFVALFSCFGGTGPCQATFRDYIAAYPGFVKVNASVGQQLTSALSGFVSVDNLTNNHAHEYYNTGVVWGRITTVGFRFHY